MLVVSGDAVAVSGMIVSSCLACCRCGMRYFRYKKSDPPKDPFTQRIYDDIVSKRKVGDQHAQCALGCAVPFHSPCNPLS